MGKMEIIDLFLFYVASLYLSFSTNNVPKIQETLLKDVFKSIIIAHQPVDTFLIWPSPVDIFRKIYTNTWMYDFYLSYLPQLPPPLLPYARSCAFNSFLILY